MQRLQDAILRYVRERALLRAGDRVGVAVSGGADSVALLRILLDLRVELGIVLTVVHMNHQLRGRASDSEAEFVAALAREHNLEFFSKQIDVRAYAAEHGLGLEAAGRELRYEFFDELAREGHLDRIATAHTLDDQAETVLLRLFRGAWTRGLAGIYPELECQHVSIVRPLLATRRADLRAYLNSLGQSWREDATNQDLGFARNRVRHELLPLLERAFNSEITERLAETAELARAEQEYWDAEARSAWEKLTGAGVSSFAQRRLGSAIPFDFAAFAKLPLAAQRRLLHSFTGISALDFHHVEQLRGAALASDRAGREIELPGGCSIRFGQRELWIERRCQTSKGQFPPPDEQQGYVHRLPVPGAVHVPELASSFTAVVLRSEEKLAGYDPASLLRVSATDGALLIRNWRPGDRFWPAHTRAPEKVKRLLTERRIAGPERERWPVIESAGKLLWMRGFPVAADAVAQPNEPAVLIKETAAGSAEKSET